MSKKYTVEQFRKYLLKQESRGDIMYNLSEENIEKAQGNRITDDWEDRIILTFEDDASDDDIKYMLIEYMVNEGIETSGHEEIMSLDELLEDLNYSIER